LGIDGRRRYIQDQEKEDRRLQQLEMMAL
jgi:hypothetical protein